MISYSLYALCAHEPSSKALADSYPISISIETVSMDPSASAESSNPEDGVEKDYWMCCGGGEGSCRENGVWLVEIYPACVECEHRKCDKCEVDRVVANGESSA